MGGRPEVLEITHGEKFDTIKILTMSGEKVDSSDRQVVDVPF